MAQNPRPATILDSFGEEIVRIITPVSICMFMVVVLVSLLGSDSSIASTSIATVAYSETSSDSSWDKFLGALLNSLVFVAVVTVVTFGLVLLFYLRCTRFLKLYMGFSAFMVLGFLGGQIALFVVQDFAIPIDCVTFGLVLFNFSVLGVLAVFVSKMPILVTQVYLVLIGMFVAYWFTLLPEWTTWVLLVAMSLYDLAAVLLPMGPLRLLVELAVSRDEDIPALVYEARPVAHDHSPSHPPGPRWRRIEEASDSNLSSDSTRNEANSVSVERDEEEVVVVAPLLVEGQDEEEVVVVAPPVEGRDDDMVVEGLGLGSSGAIKLGLGDFIFYSVLVGRAAMYDYMTVAACYLAIVAGLGVTLAMLASFRKALPALPVSVLLGVSFYFLTRFLLEAFVIQCSLNLLMF